MSVRPITAAAGLRVLSAMLAVDVSQQQQLPGTHCSAANVSSVTLPADVGS